jgi:hypothetical protein
MYAPQIPQFFSNPLADASTLENLRAVAASNQLHQKQLADQASMQRGYMDFYNNQNAPQPPQESQLGPMGQQLIGNSEGQNALMPQQPRQPFVAPEGSDFNYTQGVQQSEAALQKKQHEYYSQNVAPMVQFFLDQGDNDSKNKLVEQLLVSKDPSAGFSKQLAGYLQDINFAAPGHIKDVQLTPEIRGILNGATPAVQAAINSMPEGARVEAKFDRQGKVTEIINPYSKSASTIGYTLKPVKSGNEIITYKVYKDGRPEEEFSRAPVDAGSGRKRRYVKYGDAGAIMDSWTGQLITPEKDAQGNITNIQLSADEAAELGVSNAGRKAAMKQAASPKAASLYRGLELFKDTAPKLIELKRTLNDQDRERLFPLVTQSKSWNEFSSKFELALRDNPDLTDLYKSTTLLADSLASVYGAGTGGQWSFEVAQKMLDPNIPLESFIRTLGTHQHKLEKSVESTKSFPETFKTTAQKRQEQNVGVKLTIPDAMAKAFEEFRFNALKKGFSEKEIVEYANKKWGK